MTDGSGGDTEILASRLPAKITGIVFWGMVLVGLLIAVVVLKGRESDLGARNLSEARLLALALTERIEEGGLALAEPGRSRAELERVVGTLGAGLHFEALELRVGADVVRIGRRNGDQEAVSESLRIHGRQGVSTDGAMQLTVLFPSRTKTISEYRKNVLISIGLLVLAFGLILQQILQRMLSRPFFGMVATAKRFSGGSREVRFDETRGDEFGFLAKFINRALDSIEQQQADLRRALERATRSEAELFGEKERAEVTLQSITDAVITTNSATEVQYLNPVAERLTGWANLAARGLPLEDVIHLVHEESGQAARNPVPDCLANNSVEGVRGPAALRRRDGTVVAIEASAAPMRNDAGDVIGAVMVCQDVSQARKLAHQLSHQASHDSLTGLANRREFEHRLDAALESAQREGKRHVLLYLDLDQFKVVNDTCGHVAGDQLLAQLGNLLGHKVRNSDTLARLGGDEFGVLLEGCDLERGEQIAESLCQSVADFRFVWKDKIFPIGVSIGLVEINDSSENSAAVLSAADAACYVAKDEGRSRVEVFRGDKGGGERYGEMQWVARIHKAMQENRLLLYRQNIVAVAGGEGTAHAEILLRMRDENGSIVPPMAFIPAAERYHLMAKIDRWVVTNALEWLAAHPLTPSRQRQCFSINLSGQSLGDGNFLQFVVDELVRTGVPAERVCFEVTETAAIANIGRAREFIAVLKARGCTFALDDFGSGMSSYSYLKNLDVDYLKIDGAFVKDMALDPVDFAMVESINRIGHVMGIRIIAEFVENGAILAKLEELGVDFAQGYGIHKPEALLSPAAEDQAARTAGRVRSASAP
ncbi:EAL domain-containing protein [Thiobacillus sedimenti]|uniref:EAL domain-containing protein n=1 Tax=Thiobacillus sedimenti TaxID=3110231 RepID=A0ABZ1CF20_9PROT|nr:EAL domain-containing protein [Thiobacillus sp. SCUT-2]WRS37965.1 EAL domain-containing protein [Thiobacillus sp. SCUT-2]